MNKIKVDDRGFRHIDVSSNISIYEGIYFDSRKRCLACVEKRNDSTICHKSYIIEKRENESDDDAFKRTANKALNKMRFENVMRIILCPVIYTEKAIRSTFSFIADLPWFCICECIGDALEDVDFDLDFD
jgi:hypothetical protein